MWFQQQWLISAVYIFGMQHAIVCHDNKNNSHNWLHATKKLYQAAEHTIQYK